ncbi:twin-arginine translocase TatA/TatE family subunit [Microbacterium testaceum]|nr:twin-arginine translocase TatA/TatE family subunit [Microbacterium testaceum]
MFGNVFSGWHLVLVLVLVLLLFGAAKLPGLAKSVGESVRILKKESRAAKTEATETVPTADLTATIADAPAQSGPGSSSSA